MGLLDGKVAVVTGAGGGLGRAHALKMASEGARIVVNDLGTSVDGEGEGRDLADRVVDEIEEAGGEAVANKASVADPEGAQSIVDQALEAFGRLDVVVNNAGILRDKTIVKMNDEMWRDVLDVHLDGTFYVTRAALRAFEQRQEGGRIINTTSLAGLKGNFGQANYGAAKAGIAGLTRVAALEGQKAGVTVNAIAPVAKTRMTEEIDAVPDEFEPDEISPLVAWLASDESEDVNGRIFGAHGSHYFEYVLESSPGVEPEERWDPSEIGERFEAITEMPTGDEATTDEETAGRVRTLFEALPETIDDSRASGWSATIQFDVPGAGTYAIEIDDGVAQFSEGEAGDPDGTVSFDAAETLLQMAAGELDSERAFMAGQIEADNMKVLMDFGKYFDLERAAGALDFEEEAEETTADESSEGIDRDLLGAKFRGSARIVEREAIEAYADATENDNPQHYGEDAIAPPLFPVRIFHPLLEEVMTDDRLDVNLLNVLHGEQEMRFHRPIEPKDLVAPRARITDIQTKVSGEVMTVHFRLMRAGELVAEADTVLFVKSEGGSSSSDSSSAGGEDEEAGAGELVHEASQFVDESRPKRYAEASGDDNPIHTDPQVAEAAGLPGVILHGLCTMAFASNAAVAGLCDGDARRLERLKVRFSKPVFPGQTVTTRIWEGEGDGYRLDAVNDEGDQVLERGVVEVEG